MSKKIVLITGTNSGFGWLTAHSVAALGHKVYATMRDVNGKNADKAKALAAVESITVLDVALTDDESVKQAVDSVIAKEGTIDVLVNNAGVSLNGVAESFTTANVQYLFDVNVFAPWRFIKQVLPVMRKQSEGLIINVTSGFGRVSFPLATIYTGSKFGLEGISEGLHYELSVWVLMWLSWSLALFRRRCPRKPNMLPINLYLTVMVPLPISPVK